MPEIILLNKPFNVLSQFSDSASADALQSASHSEKRATLANFISAPGFRAAGRLDYDSEGLLLLTDDGQLQNQIASPKFKLPKTYWAQVEGTPVAAQLRQLETGVELNDGLTLPAKARLLEEIDIWPRNPPIRHRLNVPTAWIELIICEGRNRQVRRMTAAVGLPTLRLIRISIGSWHLDGMQPGQFRREPVAAAISRSKSPVRQPTKDRHAPGHGDFDGKRRRGKAHLPTKPV